ncbi:MAG: hypothetical protein ACK5L0_04335 [Candidatus Fimivivens sp.]
MRLLALLLSLLLLSACNGVQLGINELLEPPRLTTQQSAIYDAVELAVGTDTFKLRYPRRGENLSACVLNDLDQDGQDEAIVFYELTVNGLTSSWMSILTEDDGVWKSRYQLPGEGGDIDFVSFAAIENTARNNIIVGWTVAGKNNLVCKVYAYADESAEMRYEGNYNEILIDDVDGNGLAEMVLCTKNLTKSAVMSLIKYRSGRIVRTSEVKMPTAMTDYAKLSYGKLTSGLNAVFADIYLGADEMTTRIAVVDDQKSIIEPLSNEELGIYESFDRATPTLTCADVNGDGLIDIPISSPLPGYSTSEEREVVYLTEYMSILAGELKCVQRSVVNFAAGYQLKLPDGWKDSVTVRRQSDTGEWRFMLFDKSIENASVELLRIRVVSPSDYQDKFETTPYSVVGTKGVNSYQIHIPEEGYPGYSITYEQAQSLFSMLDLQ